METRKEIRKIEILAFTEGFVAALNSMDSNLAISEANNLAIAAAVQKYMKMPLYRTTVQLLFSEFKEL